MFFLDIEGNVKRQTDRRTHRLTSSIHNAELLIGSSDNNTWTNPIPCWRCKWKHFQ